MRRRGGLCPVQFTAAVQGAQFVDRAGLGGRLVVAVAQHAGEAQREAAGVPAGPLDAVERDLNDLQASPQYPGGLALRFARIKGYRPDKSPADADTIATLREIWRRQSGEGTETA